MSELSPPEPPSMSSSTPPQQQQTITGATLTKSQVAQAGRDVHQNYQEIHYHQYSQRLEASAQRSVHDNDSPENALLQQVSAEISGRLESSLHTASFINLNKEKQSSQVQRLWDAEIKIGQKEESVQLEVGTQIIEVFDQKSIAGKLLILGAPGAGKTTTLLELADVLVKRAEDQKTEPIPILLSLSSWKNNQPLDQWLIQEVSDKYGVRKASVVRDWLRGRQLLPLLDGLDEVDVRYHAACIESINQFCEEHQPRHTVVCSRIADYENTQTKLRLNGAIYLRSLSPDQIRDYLLGTEQPEVWKSVESDDSMMRLARFPLFLSILAQARQAISLDEWQQLTTSEEQREYLVQSYVTTMLSRPISNHWYAPGSEPSTRQTKRWLGKLARQLSENSQSEFLIERIEPNWLETARQRQLYRASYGLVLGTVLGVVGGFAEHTHGAIIAYANVGLWRSLISGLSVSFFYAVLYGLGSGISCLLFFGLSSRRIVFFASGIIFGLLYGLSEAILNRSFYAGLVSGLIFALLLAVYAVLNLDRPVKFIETLSWSGSKAKKGVAYGFVVGAAFVPLYAPWEGIEFSGQILLTCVLLCAVGCGLLGGFWHLLKPQAIAKTHINAVKKVGRYGFWLGSGLGLLLNLLIVAVAFFSPEYIEDVLISGFGFAASVVIWIITYQIIGGVVGLLLGGGLGWAIAATSASFKVIKQSFTAVETKQWRWSGFVKGIAAGIIAGAFLGLMLMSQALGGDPFSRFGFMIFGGILFGAIGGLSGAAMSGFRGPDIEIRKFPNQGIRRSAVNAAAISLLASFLTAAMIMSLSWLGSGFIYGLNYGLLFGMLTLMGCFVSLASMCMRHVAIRIALYRHGLAPWDYPKFLNYAAERMLVRQVGGRYQFIHAVFQQYFATF